MGSQILSKIYLYIYSTKFILCQLCQIFLGTEDIIIYEIDPRLRKVLWIFENRGKKSLKGLVGKSGIYKDTSIHSDITFLISTVGVRKKI